MVNSGASKGCLNCRIRKVKCDLTRPSCRNCLKRRITCPGVRQLQFRDVNFSADPQSHRSTSRALTATKLPEPSLQMAVTLSAAQPGMTLSLHQRPEVLLPTSSASSALEDRLELYFDHTTRELLDYSYRVYWPGFDPASTGNLFYHPWLTNLLEHPALFHCLMWAAALHMNALRPQGKIDVSSLRHKQKVVQMLSQAINKQETLDEDWHLMSIISLATPETTIITPPPPEHLFRPPLQNLLWLNIYSRNAFAEEHWRALLVVVAGRGGQDAPNMAGFNFKVHSSDTIRASINLCAPTLPLCQQYKSLREIEHRGNMFGQPQMQVSSETTPDAFSALRDTVDTRLVDALLDIKAYTKLLELCCTQEREAMCNLTQLGLHRNIVQHGLLSACFGSVDDINRNEESSDKGITSIVSVIKWASICFAITVTFPIANQRPLRQALNRLRVAVAADRTSGSLGRINAQDLLHWACMIGALGSAETSLRPWFVENLAALEMEWLDSHPYQATRRSWADVRSIVHKFLWLDLACDDGGGEIWSRVEEKVEMRLGFKYHV